MSGLSDILDRELRKLKPELFPTQVKEAPKKVTQADAKSIMLGYCLGSSDKVYYIQLVMSAGGGFDVMFQYGRRGGRLQEGIKNAHPLSFSEATYIYEELIREKKAKGYKEI
jgi:predicted DNA-binding WGR domain protein